nr:hypothetical protein [Candidatus Sigynarchaeota archaeon]
MMLDPIPVTLICGMGSHARSVFIYAQHYALQRIYIVYSKYNTDEYEAIAARITREIEQNIKTLDHSVAVFHVRIDEREFLSSFETIARIYDQEKNNHIITDLTAGHKIISYLLFYAHAMSAAKFRFDARIVYLFEENDVPMEIPGIDVKPVDSKLLTFLRDIDQYNSRFLELSPISVEPGTRRKKHFSLAGFLASGPTPSGEHYEPVAIHRYKKRLRELQLIDDSGNTTIKGRMQLIIG